MNFNYVRKIVSGKKARFIDPETAVNLDLVYVTDRIIIMGYPASGFESLYRNRRSDVVRFIESRHQDKWWIFNLCPVYENTYSPESMRNRVSRYPFPDHHPPPLGLVPLVVREMSNWLEGDEERVAVIHCKAGKGRTGTILCSYMLSLNKLPPPPQLDRSYTYKELMKRKLTQGVAVGSVPEERGENDWMSFEEPQVERAEEIKSVSSEQDSSGSSPSNSKVWVPIDIGDNGDVSEVSQWDRRDGKLDKVFKFHSSRRMKPTSTGRGVSIPSQRRWCRYVHLIYNEQLPNSFSLTSTPQIRLLSVTIVLRSPGWNKPVTSMLVGGSKSPNRGRAWASVARYRDDYVEKLQRLGGDLAGRSGQVVQGGVGGQGEFDSKKMFRSTGKIVSGKMEQGLGIEDKDVIIHHLVPATTEGIILDRCREVRVKLHIGSLPLGWLWFIPAFHLPEPLPTSKRSCVTAAVEKGSTPSRIQTLSFPKTQIDFALGPGAMIRQVIIRLEEVPQGVNVGEAKQMNEKEEEAAGLAKENDERGDKVKE